MATTPEEDLKLFKFERILNQDTGRKYIGLLGSINGNPAIITAEKTAFDANNVANFVTPGLGLDQLNLVEKNDIYHWFMATFHQNAKTDAALKVNLIYPCTDAHIRKYSAQKAHMVVETPEIYEKYIIKYIDNYIASGRLSWVYNILEHRKESEKIIFEDPDKTTGFILLPDMKWDLVTMTSMYLTVIVHRTDIKSIRDLNGSHIPFLVNIRDRVEKEVAAKFAEITADKLKLYIHYHPSYYHFHIHVVHISHDMGLSATIGKAILLNEVIQNLQIMKAVENAGGEPIGYKDINITYALGEEHDLWKKLFSKVMVGLEPIT